MLIAGVGLLVCLVAAITELLWATLFRSGGWPLPLAWPLALVWVILLLLSRRRTAGEWDRVGARLRLAGLGWTLGIGALVLVRWLLLPFHRQPSEPVVATAAIGTALLVAAFAPRLAAGPLLPGAKVWTGWLHWTGWAHWTGWRRWARWAPTALATFALASTVTAWVVLTRADRFAGHDEAVYAGMARAWAGPLPAAGALDSRPVGVPALGALVLAGFGDAANPAAAPAQLLRLRVLGLVLVLLALLAMGLLGRAVTTPARAATAVLVVAGAASVQRRLAELMVDLPAAGLLCLVLLAVLHWWRSGRLSSLLIAAGLAAVTFYVRYGALAGLVAIAVGVLVAAGPRLLWHRRAQLALAGGVLLLALCPQLAWSWRQTGTPWGVLVASERSSTPGYPGQGLLGYLLWLPLRLAGDLGGVLLVAGFAGLLHRHRRRQPAESSWVVLFGVTALVQTVALGLQAQPDERFLFFPIMIGVITGVHVLVEASGRWGRPVLAVLILLAVLHVPASIWFEQARLEQAATERAPLAHAAGSGSFSRPCLIIGPRYGPAADPEAGWYSGCSVTAYTAVRRLPGGLPDGTVALLQPVPDTDPREHAIAGRLIAARGKLSQMIFPGDPAHRTPGVELIRLGPPR